MSGIFFRVYRQEWPDPDARYRSARRERRVEFRPARGRARVAVWLLALAVAANVVCAILGFVNVALLTSAIGDPARADELVEQRDSLVGVAAIVYWGTMIPAGIAVAVWLTRTYGNVDALAPGAKRHWTGWAWLSWIIPILNLFRPKQIVNDIWRASHGSVPAFVLAWWALWLGAGIANRVLNRIDIDSLQQFRWLDGVEAMVMLAMAGAGLLAIRLVRRTTDLQEEHSRRPPPEPDREQRIARDGEIPDGFTIKPAWAPSEQAD